MARQPRQTLLCLISEHCGHLLPVWVRPGTSAEQEQPPGSTSSHHPEMNKAPCLPALLRDKLRCTNTNSPSRNPRREEVTGRTWHSTALLRTHPVAPRCGPGTLREFRQGKPPHGFHPSTSLQMCHRRLLGPHAPLQTGQHLLQQSHVPPSAPAPGAPPKPRQNYLLFKLSSEVAGEQS